MLASVLTMPQRPDPRRSPTPYSIGARLTPSQYAALLALAEHRDIPLSAALRVMIDDYIDRHDPQAKATRALLDRPGATTSVEPDPDWQQRHGTARPPV